jgi:hypothetical protein
MPRKPAEETIAVKVRIRDSLREKLETVAAERGTSLNQEIVERLNKSVEPKRHWETFDNAKANAIVDLLAQVIYAAGHNAGGLATAGSSDGSRTWYDIPFAFDQVRKAVDVTLHAIRPPGSADLKELASRLPSDKSHVAKSMTEKDSFFKNLGEIAAWGILSELKIVDDAGSKTTLTPERADRARKLKSALGHMAERIPE